MTARSRQRGVGLNEIKVVSDSTALQAGDADMDLELDHLDIVQVLQGGKYLTGEPATWGEGDWNGAPGGESGNPPVGDGVFDQLDVVAAITTDPWYTPYANPSACGDGQRYTGIVAQPIAPGGVVGDDRVSIVYDPQTGEVAVDAAANSQLTSINVDSVAEIFTGAPALDLGGPFDSDYDDRLFKATFGTSFGSLSLGNVVAAGLRQTSCSTT